MDALGDTPPPLSAPVARQAVAEARTRVRRGADVTLEEVVVAARTLLRAAQRTRLQRVVNATGVLVHTNLGRVPLGRAQLDAIASIAGNYSNLEYDLAAGRRGDRYAHAGVPLATLTGAEAALVVNNCAAALLLALSTLCANKEVVIARGELIEIGGGFRIPEVLAASGARLVEVGTTNRTKPEDYERAIGPDTAAVLKVHPSNYRMIGFTASVDARALASLAHDRGLPLIYDLGSGLIERPEGAEWAEQEPTVADAVADGADLVTFSGDKLLGGPQAGLLVGRRNLIEAMRRHPLLRAVRVDKLVLAALEATLDLMLRHTSEELPLWGMGTASSAVLEARAVELARQLTAELGGGGVKAEAVASRAVAGGGTLPGIDLVSWAVSIVHPERSAAAIERALRLGDVPVIARIEDGQLLVDLRAVPTADDPLLRDLIVTALTS
jgi:L-seryl-tRNA(Ser) seleniumtransferase